MSINDVTKESSPRTTTIAVNEYERELLNKARLDLYETTEVPYGVLLRHLVDVATDVEAETVARDFTK